MFTLMRRLPQNTGLFRFFSSVSFGCAGLGDNSGYFRDRFGGYR
jgi:hypothetical protein